MFYYKPAKNGQWRWAFVATNGQMSASTETFPTRSNAKRAAKKFLIAAMKSQEMKYNADSFKILEWGQRPGAKK